MLVRRHQVLLKNEATEGANSNPGAGDALTLAAPPTIRTAIETIDQAAPSGSLTRLKSVVGRAELGLTLPTYLIGSRDPKDLGISEETPLPPQHQALLSCGMRMDKLAYQYVNTTAQNGVFLPGMVVEHSNPPVEDTVVAVSRPRADGTGLVILTDDGGLVQSGTGITFSGTSGLPTITATPNGNGVLRRVYRYRPNSRTTIRVVANHQSWNNGWDWEVGDLLVRCNTTAEIRVTGWYAVEGRIIDVEDNYGGSAPQKAFTIETTSVEPYAVGMRVTKIDRVTGAIYTPTVSGNPVAPNVLAVEALDSPSSTILSLLDGLGRRSRGARGNMRIEGQAGQAVRMDFEFTGSFENPEDGELLPGVTLIDLNNVPRLEYTAVLLDGNPFPGQSLRFDLANTVSPNIDYHGANGVRGARIGDRNPNAFLDPLMQHPTVFDFYKKQLTAASVSLVAQIGYQAANTVLLTIPVGQMEVADGERDGAVTAETTLRARYSGADDEEFTLVYF